MYKRQAEEVAISMPTTNVVASRCRKTAEEIQDIFMNDVFRVYTHNDVLGVELGGAIKNVIALCAGIADGLGSVSYTHLDVYKRQVQLGALLSAHHENLRKLGVSTEKIDQIIETACKAGAYGGKVNGSGGGGCCYVYAAAEDAEKIIKEVGKLGYPGKVLKQDTGFRCEA